MQQTNSQQLLIKQKRIETKRIGEIETSNSCLIYRHAKLLPYRLILPKTLLTCFGRGGLFREGPAIPNSPRLLWLKTEIGVSGKIEKGKQRGLLGVNPVVLVAVPTTDEVEVLPGCPGCPG